MLNPDLVFVEDVFPPLLDLLETRQAEIVAPLIVDARGDVQDSFRSLPHPFEILVRRTVPQSRVAIAPAGSVLCPDWLAGMFILMSPHVFRSLGGFDEKHFLYFEDVDFGTRARLADYRLALHTGVKVVHDTQRASRRDLRYLLYHLRSAFRFFT